MDTALQPPAPSGLKTFSSSHKNIWHPTVASPDLERGSLLGIPEQTSSVEEGREMYSDVKRKLTEEGNENSDGGVPSTSAWRVKEQTQEVHATPSIFTPSRTLTTLKQ